MLGPAREVAGSGRQGMPAIQPAAIARRSIKPQPARPSRAAVLSRKSRRFSARVMRQVLTGGKSPSRSVVRIDRQSIHVEKFVRRQQRSDQARPGFRLRRSAATPSSARRLLVAPEVVGCSVRFLVRRRPRVGCR